MRALLIDDDLTWLEAARKTIEGLGAEVALNIGPIGALSAARIFCPDVVFLNLGMQGLGDSRLFAELKKTVPRIYFCTSGEADTIKPFAYGVGASGTISKTEARVGSSGLRAIIEGKQ